MIWKKYTPPENIPRPSATNAYTTHSNPGAATLSYSAPDLPAGLSINTITGVITGTLASGDDTGGFDGAGDYMVTVKATDGNGCFGTLPLTLFVNNSCPVIIVNAPSTLTPAYLGVAYGAVNFTQTGGFGGCALTRLAEPHCQIFVSVEATRGYRLPGQIEAI